MDHSHHTMPNDHHSMHQVMEAAPAAAGVGMPDEHDDSAMMNAPTMSTMDSHAGHDMMRSNYYHGGTGTGMEHMMSMAFHFGYNETILFSWWHIETVSGLLASMLAIFLLALAYEGLKYYREYLLWNTYNLLEYRPVMGPQRNPEAPSSQTTTTATSPVQYVGEVVHKQPPSMLSLSHLYQTFLHMIQVTLSFLLMLIFMTYNVWLCMTVILGASVGYYLLCWKKSVIVDVTEHCH